MKTSIIKIRVMVGLFFLLSIFSLQAAEIAGVNIPQQVSIKGLQQPLQLNGAGIRSKFFFKIYIGALYLPEKQNSARKILEQSVANRVLMHFLYDEVSSEKLQNAWQEGFENNTQKSELEALQDRLNRFKQMFPDLHQGEQVLLDYIPGQGTRVSINGEQKGRIEGADFNRALLAVWLGDEPVTEDLKEAMLGRSDED